MSYIHKIFSTFFIRILLLAFLLFQFRPSDAGEQSRIIDSLKNVLAGDLDDTTRFNTLILLSDEYAKTDIQSSLTEGLNAINFAKENNITIPKKLYINIADYFFKLGEYEEEINYLNKVIEIFKNNNDSMNIAYTNNELAEAIFLTGDYTHAIEILKKNIQYCKKYDFQKCLLKSYYRIGTIFNRLNDHEIAIKYYKEYLNRATETNDKEEISNALEVIGQTKQYDKEWEQALNYYLESLSIRQEIEDTTGIWKLERNIGYCYYQLDDSDNAIEYYKKFLQSSILFKDNWGQWLGYYNLGFLYLELDNYNMSSKYLEKALALAEKLDYARYKYYVYEALAKYYSKKQDYKTAYDYHSKLTVIMDSLFVEKTNIELMDMQTRYESEKKQSKLELLSMRLRANRYIAIGLLFVLVLGIIVAIMFFRQKNARMRERLAEMKQIALSQQMNPHFIFNALTSIQNYILQNDKALANKYLTKFAKLIRKILDNSQHAVIPLKDELNALQLYMEIESLRFKNKFDFDIITDKNLDLTYYKIPTLLIQPFAENAIWHGIMHKGDKGKVIIEVKQDKNLIICSIEDDGIGREKAMQIKEKSSNVHKSLGTFITAERINIINSLYSGKMDILTLDLKDENQNPVGTRVEIKLPLIK